MSAGKHGPSEITITLDDSGGTPRAVTSFVMGLSPAELEALLEETTPLGASFQTFAPVGVMKISPFTLTGKWDDSATTSPHVVMNNPAASVTTATQTLVLVFGNGRTFTVECYVQKYAVLGKQNGLTEFSCVLQPTGSGAWS